MNRHIMTRLIAVVAALSLALFATAQNATAQNAGANAGASAVTQAVFYNNHPQQGGEVIAELDAHAAAAANFDEAAFVVLRGADFAYTFAVSQEAEAEGELLVALQHSQHMSESAALTISEVIARLDTAFRGDVAIGVFTEGETDGGVVVAMYEIDEDSAAAQVEVDNATHVELIVNGTAESFELAITGDTMADLSVQTASVTENLVDLTLSLDLDTHGAASVETRAGQDESDTETDSEEEAAEEAAVGVGVGVDVGVDTETDTDADTEREVQGETDGDVEGDTEGDAETEIDVEVGVGVSIGGGDEDSEESN